jgi:NAD(P)-dependent dehydrogenase (short-subunit alcohol dehydrogenase family)
MTAIRLDGAAVAVTGGARGIGLATAKAFAATGAHVYIGDLDEPLAKEAAADVDPERIADAVVASCRHRSAIVVIPAWMRSYEAASALVPDRLLGAIRGRLTRDRVLRTLDTGARAAYDARVRRDASAPERNGSR